MCRPPASLDDTLVVWGGELGRMLMSEIPVPSEADNAGRDHHPVAFSMFMAGGALKPDQRTGSRGGIKQERNTWPLRRPGEPDHGRRPQQSLSGLSWTRVCASGHACSSEEPH